MFSGFRRKDLFKDFYATITTITAHRISFSVLVVIFLFWFRVVAKVHSKKPDNTMERIEFRLFRSAVRNELNSLRNKDTLLGEVIP